MHNSTVATVGCSYMFRLLKSSHHQAVCQNLNLMLVIPMCLSNTYKYKIPVETRQFFIK